MFFILLSGCGLFQEADLGRAIPTTDDTSLITTDTGTRVTETDTATDTETEELPLSIALYAMTIPNRPSDNIEIITANLDTMTIVDTTYTQMTGVLNMSNSLTFAEEERMLLATGNTDRTISGFLIDDSTGILAEPGWSPLMTDETSIAMAWDQGLLYWISETYIGVSEFDDDNFQHPNTSNICGGICTLHAITTRSDRRGYVVIYNSNEYLIGLIGGDQNLQTSHSTAESHSGLKRIVPWGEEGLIYATGNEGVTMFNSEDQLDYLGMVSQSCTANIAVGGANGTFAYELSCDGDSNVNGTLRISEIMQRGGSWVLRSSHISPLNAEYIYASENFLAISSPSELWVYGIDSAGGANLLHQFDGTNTGTYFGPMVIVEGASSN